MRAAPAVLVLEDGRIFRGQAWGAKGETYGEAVFSTGMSGYEEALTDKSAHGQVLVMTWPHIGNTGITTSGEQSAPIHVAGLVVRDPARKVSSWRATRSLGEELEAQGIVAISGVDTRALTHHLRDNGSMRVGISSLTQDTDEVLAKVRGHVVASGGELVSAVTTRDPYVVPAEGQKRASVAVLDLGVGATTLEQLAARGVEVHVLPASTQIEELTDKVIDGVFVSNGPGTPETLDDQVAFVDGVLERGLPCFAVGLGHQVLARALELPVQQLGHGHHGANVPVKNLATGRVEITAHGHGTGVEAPLDGGFETKRGSARVSHLCLNDNTVEGIELVDRHVFGVQFDPGAAAGPRDAQHLFDRFVELLNPNQIENKQEVNH